jgi:phage terminase Nu1 subunit (DNA packaging protein)
MHGFKLSELHDGWAALQTRGRLAANLVPVSVQSALKELGLAEVDWITQDIVLTEAGIVGPRKAKL